MSILELSQKYGRSKSNQAVNAAIRAEIPGGNEAIDFGAKYAGRILSAKAKPSAQPTPAEIYAEVYADFQRIRDIMGDEIARRYGLKPKISEDNDNAAQN